MDGLLKKLTQARDVLAKMTKPRCVTSTTRLLTKPLFTRNNSMAKINLTASNIKEVMSYDPDSGLFTRLVSSSNSAAGKILGSKHSEGYVVINILGANRLAHRLAWLYVHGEMPNGHIDHINGDRSDNRLANLRCVTNSQNMQNRRSARKSSGTGFLGVTKSRYAFTTMIRANGKSIHIGSFKTAELAYAAYLDAKRRLHPMCEI